MLPTVERDRQCRGVARGPLKQKGVYVQASQLCAAVLRSRPHLTMKPRDTARRWSPGLLSVTFCRQRRRGAAAVIMWFEALQFAICADCAPPKQRPSYNIGVGAAGLPREGARMLAARMKESGKAAPGDVSDALEALVQAERYSLSEAQWTPSTLQAVQAGPAEKRRLSSLSSSVRKKAPLGAALLVGVIAGITTLLYGSPKQAYKRLKLRARRKVPWSWSSYLRSLPVIKESDFPDFPRKWPKSGNRLLVMLVKDVSPELARFLNLRAKERLHGIAIKATPAGKHRSAETILNEINAHVRMVPRSKFILPVLGAYRAANGKRVYLILPRLRGSARIMLEKEADTVNVQPALAEMAYSVKVLHDAGFLHRDIKLANFLVGFDGHMMLSDFEGTFDKTMWVDSERDLVVYSEGYLAPEIRSDKRWIRFSEKSDVYALGICFKKFLKEADYVPRKAQLQHLVQRMTERDVSRRYTMDQVFESPFFLGFDFNKIEQLSQGVPFPGGYKSFEDTPTFL